MKRNFSQQEVLSKKSSSSVYNEEPSVFRNVQEIPSIFTIQAIDETMFTTSDINDCDCIKGETKIRSDFILFKWLFSLKAKFLNF